MNVIEIALQGEIQIITFPANRDRWSHDALLFVPWCGINDKVHAFHPILEILGYRALSGCYSYT